MLSLSALFARTNSRPLFNARATTALGTLLLATALACSDDTKLGPLADAGAAGVSAGAAGASGASASGGSAGSTSSAGASSAGASSAGSAGESSAGSSGAAGSGGAAGEGGGGGLPIGGSPGGGAGGAPAANLIIKADTKLKRILYGNGAPVYVFGRDVPANAANPALSACTDTCPTSWPPFHMATPIAGDGLDPKDFGEFTRADGAKQMTYQGWPLYTYAAEAGDTPAGDGQEALWHAAAVPSYTFEILRKETSPGVFLTYLGDNRGMAIYTYLSDTAATADAGAVSACTNKCLNNWPPVTTTQLRLVSSLDAKKFGFFVRPDTSAIQLTYQGMPLYLYSKDLKPGDTTGHSTELWHVAQP